MTHALVERRIRGSDHIWWTLKHKLNGSIVYLTIKELTVFLEEGYPQHTNYAVRKNSLKACTM